MLPGPLTIFSVVVQVVIAVFHLVGVRESVKAQVPPVAFVVGLLSTLFVTVGFAFPHFVTAEVESVLTVVRGVTIAIFVWGAIRGNNALLALYLMGVIVSLAQFVVMIAWQPIGG